MRNLIFLLVGGAGLMFIVYQIVKFFFSISNPKSRVEKDRKYGLIKLRELADDLIPLDNNELSLLSLKRKATPSRKTFHSEEFGYLETIYNENLVAYYLYDYLDDRKLLVTETSVMDVELYKENDVTNIWQNGKLVFQIDQLGRLSSMQNNRILASISLGAQQNYSTINIKGEVRAHLTNVEDELSEQQRAYPIIELVDDEESSIIYCLTMYHLFLR
jgi:hypothetical protein